MIGRNYKNYATNYIISIMVIIYKVKEFKSNRKKWMKIYNISSS
jgi:hypothetical protein